MSWWSFFVPEPPPPSSSSAMSDLLGQRQTKWVRRPLRGIEVRRDTYASIQVAKRVGTTRAYQPIIDSSSMSALSTSNTNFVLNRVQVARAEKQQIVQTFGPFYIFFYDGQPILLNVQAMLLDTPDFNWVAEWWANYELYLRGTRCVDNGTRVVLSYKDVVAEGYILQAQTDHVAESDHQAMLTFSMILTSYTNLTVMAEQPGAVALPPPLDPEPEFIQQGGVDFWREYSLGSEFLPLESLKGWGPTALEGLSPAGWENEAFMSILRGASGDPNLRQIFGLTGEETDKLVSGSGGVGAPSDPGAESPLPEEGDGS